MQGSKLNIFANERQSFIARKNYEASTYKEGLKKYSSPNSNYQSMSRLRNREIDNEGTL